MVSSEDEDDGKSEDDEDVGLDFDSDVDDGDEEGQDDDVKFYFKAVENYMGDSMEMPSFPSDKKFKNPIKNFHISSTSPDKMALEVARYLETSFVVSYD